MTETLGPDDAGFRPYALTLVGQNDVIYGAAETLGFSDTIEALSVSIFDEDEAAGTSRLQALYDTQDAAKAAAALFDIPSTVERLPDEDWVSLSQAGLPPVAAGRFWVHGSHDAGDIPDGTAHPILVDAGLAFGTGHHGTTKGCLLIFDTLLHGGFAPKSVLDLGCGAGTLAIAAAMALPDLPAPVLATDIDPDAVDVTQENATLNGVSANIHAAQADGFGDPVFDNRQFDLIFANILAGPLMGLADDIVSATAPGGHVILSGIIDDMAAPVSERFTQAGLTVTPQPSLEGWTSLLAVKPDSPRP